MLVSVMFDKNISKSYEDVITIIFNEKDVTKYISNGIFR